MYDTVPDNLKDLFIIRNTRDLRNTDMKILLPMPKNEFRKKCFDYAGSILWNNLPLHIRMTNNRVHFKKIIKEYIICKRVANKIVYNVSSTCKYFIQPVHSTCIPHSIRYITVSAILISIDI